MASIYAEATVTIIAKDGPDSSYGLHGVPGSVARNLHQDIFKLASDREAIVHPWTVDKTPNPWTSRGWTFQEQFFSPGSLFLKSRQFVGNVAWQLGTRTTTSTQSQNATMQTKVTYPKLHVSEQSPNIESFGQLLTVYNKRELTYSADTLNATDGILSSLVPGIHTSEPLNLI
jgi:hypothetical protein